MWTTLIPEPLPAKHNSERRRRGSDLRAGAKRVEEAGKFHCSSRMAGKTNDQPVPEQQETGSARDKVTPGFMKMYKGSRNSPVQACSRTCRVSKRAPALNR